MIKIIAIGKIKERSLLELIADYQKKVGHFHKIEVNELSGQPENKDFKAAITKESRDILARIKTDDFVVLLDLEGERPDSLALATYLETWLSKNSNMCFVIGGSNGVDEAVKKRADYLLQLSTLTFPHQLVRLLLLEQLYRCFKIKNNQNYHK